MSQTDRIDLNRTAPIMGISEMYSITKGIKKDFELKGYAVPLTTMHASCMYKFPGEKKKDKFYEINKSPKNPDPATYSPTHEQLTKRF